MSTPTLSWKAVGPAPGFRVKVWAPPPLSVPPGAREVRKGSVGEPDSV
ncbi:MAG TPA: hypothetical protein VGJ21_08075 [Terracidiphilus sp.]